MLDFVIYFAGLAGLIAQVACAVTYTVPSTLPSNASAQLQAAPIGVSLEFFTFPAYFNDVPSTMQCLKNLEELTGTWPPVRIGGTTQDRATYNASSPNEVTYSVANASDAPDSLTFGPSFMTLASTYDGAVILGLNRRLNNQPNTIAAAKDAVSVMHNLDAIELGNEPDFYTSTDPIAGGTTWIGARDYASQVSWQAAVGGNLSKTDIFSAGVYFGTGSFENQGLAPEEGSSLEYVKDFCSHNYPQSSPNFNLSLLMSHSNIASQISQYKAEYAAATAVGKPYIMGETNSATQGGGGISPTFGAGLWVMDYSIQLLILGVKSLYFHQGTIGNCQYCWWGQFDMGAPYYGAYFATLALANASHIAPLDTATNNYAGYAIFEGSTVSRVLLYNSDYYASGTRSSQTFTLQGLTSTSVTAKRLTAAFATSRQDQGQNPSLAGQTFVNGTCNIQGTATSETTTVTGGKATFTVAASQALLVYL